VLLDDETNSAFEEWIKKIFSVAGLRQYEPHIYIIVNSEVNAAASLGGSIFIFSEFLMKCDNADQFLGVMAHEVGHIAGGHISRMDAAQNQALVPAAAAVILGGALALASGNTAPLEAALAGGAHVFERGMLKFSRTQESSADQAALTYLDKLGWPAEGLSQFLDKVSKMYGSSARIDPYSITHPLTPDRIQGVHDHIRKCHHQGRTLPSSIESKFQRIKAKMMAFLDPMRALATYSATDTSLPARYARAIALYRQGQFGEALGLIEMLLNDHPKDPYFYELKGQVLFDTGEIEKAIPALQKASSLRSHNPLIKIMLAHALIERKFPPGSDEAITLLLPLTQKHPQDYPMAWRLLATAYGKSHHLGEAALALAEEALLQEDYKAAISQANRAKSLLKSNHKALRRAEDLLTQVKQKMGG
jgi:predicted Zn-dependent protease